MTLLATRHIAVLLALAVPAALDAQAAAKAAPTPAAAVEEFMRAVADSNLTRMSQLYGNGSGSAYVTHQPKGFEKRMVIIQALIHGVQAKTLGEVPAAKGGMRTVTTKLSHNGCTVTIPVNVIKSDLGWLVHDFDDVEASKINQPCEGSKRPGNYLQ